MDKNRVISVNTQMSFNLQVNLALEVHVNLLNVDDIICSLSTWVVLTTRSPNVFHIFKILAMLF